MEQIFARFETIINKLQSTINKLESTINKLPVTDNTKIIHQINQTFDPDASNPSLAFIQCNSVVVNNNYDSKWRVAFSAPAINVDNTCQEVKWNFEILCKNPTKPMVIGIAEDGASDYQIGCGVDDHMWGLYATYKEIEIVHDGDNIAHKEYSQSNVGYEKGDKVSIIFNPVIPQISFEVNGILLLSSCGGHVAINGSIRGFVSTCDSNQCVRLLSVEKYNV